VNTKFQRRFWNVLLGSIIFLGNQFSLPATTAGFSATPYRSRFWQTGEEPSRNVIQAIAQTADGFLWVGTQDGLARFNGEEFEFFPARAEGESRGQKISALCASEEGGLWIGTSQGLFELQKNQWIAQLLPASVDKNILSLCRTHEGSLWIGTRAGLVRRTNKNSFVVGSDGKKGPTLLRSLASSPIRSLVEKSDGNLWAAAADDFVQVNLNDEWDSISYSLSAFKSDFIRTICCTRDGSIWIGSNSGLTRFREGNYSQFTKIDGLPDNTVTALYEDHRGNLWVGTYGGLCRFVDGKFVMEMTFEGEPYDQILCFFEDREDNLWIGAKNGLYQLNPQQFTTYTMRHGLAHNNVISVYEDNEGAMWIGTWGGGLHCLRDGKITIYAAEKNKVMRNDLVLAIQGSSDGGIWFGEDYDGGLYRLKNGDIQPYGRSQGLGRGAIRTLLEDRGGQLWIGSASSYLSVLKDGKITSYGKRDGLSTNSNRCLLQTQDGRIWVGTEAGLSCWTNGGFVTLTTNNGLSDNTIYSLYEDRQQSLWIGTGRGLNKLQLPSSRLQKQTTPPSAIDFTFQISRATPLDEPVLEILEDDFENLWLATRRGIIRVAKNELEDFAAEKIFAITSTHFGKADGMASQVCVGVAKPSAFKSKDGRLWFATTKGLAVTDPKLQIARNEKPPPVVIREVIADKKRIQEPGVGNRAFGITDHESRIIIPPGRGELEFRYTALSYNAPEKNRFKYKLEGLDADWIDAGTRHIAFYNKVPPGHYAFQVMACNNDGVWSATGASVKLHLQPHYWQTWWFKTFLILASLSIAATGARYITHRRMQFKLQRLEQQHAVEKERSRIAQDMHDDLGARLTEIVMLSNFAANSREPETKSHINKVAHTANALVRSLDALVWAVDPGNDSLENLVFYLQEYVEMFLGMTSIRYRVDIPTELAACPISSEARHNIFLATKESLNNVVKHSGASEVWFRLGFEGGTLAISIEDNGKGFSNATVSSDFGNGLGNIEKRMRKLGGRCEINSQLGKGTRIELRIPLQRSRA
jgi:ligand-binding sensor domain-containing protein/signal transduction histidine kinase